MSFGWSTFVSAAQELDLAAPDAITEARQRSGVSRAYYGVFGTACVHLESQRAWKRLGKAKDHSDLFEFLIAYGPAARGRLGQILGRMREARRKADYDDKVHNPRKLFENALSDARDALALIPRC